ncbi:hypothetical protein XI09_16115 [Bradyrhizobium sp. CCBAU 11386]|nr:hypothetical protein [Bradyrhizobium sp. CCBAU 11386]
MSDIRARIADFANGDGAVVSVSIFRRADHRPRYSVKYASQRRRGLLATLIKLTVVTAAKLIMLRRIDTPQSYARAVDFYRVAVDHAGATDDVFGCSLTTGQ